MAQIVELCDLRVARTPNVDAAGESDDEVVELAPVHQVEVVVILERWSVKNLVRDLGYLPLLGLRNDDLLMVKPAEGLPGENLVHLALFLNRLEVLGQHFLRSE